MSEKEKLPVILILIQIINYITAIGSLFSALAFFFIPTEFFIEAGTEVQNKMITGLIALVVAALSFWVIALIHMRKKLARPVFVVFILSSVVLGELMGYIGGIPLGVYERVGYILDLAMLLYVALNKRVKEVLDQ